MKNYCHEDAAGTDKILNDQAVCFFQVASGAGLGTLVIGRRGFSTRFQLDTKSLKAFLDNTQDFAGEQHEQDEGSRNGTSEEESREDDATRAVADPRTSVPHETQGKKLGQAIFIAHGPSEARCNRLWNPVTARFSLDQLEAKAMETLKELIGFGIVRVTT